MENMLAMDNVTSAHLINLLVTAEKTLRNAGFDVMQTDWIKLSDGTAIHEMFINADSDVCAENNFFIADKLTEEFEDTAMSQLSIVCRPLAHHSKFSKTMQID